jgi:hypothetical protein
VNLLRRFYDWAILAEGSTRALGILRIGLVALLWDRWGGDFLLYHHVATPGTLAVAISFYLSTFVLLFGLWSRFAAAWVAGTMLTVFYWMGIVHKVESYTHHHVFLLVCYAAFLALTPCGASFSVDRWLAVRRAEKAGIAPPPERGPLWGQRLIALQVSSLYFWAAYDKCTRAFISGERMQHIILSRYGSSDPIGIPHFELLMQVCALSTIAIEATLAFGLWVPRLRLPLLLLGAVFHGMLYVLLPVGPFSATIVLMYLAFFDADEVHRAIDRMLGRVPTAAAAATPP